MEWRFEDEITGHIISRSIGDNSLIFLCEKLIKRLLIGQKKCRLTTESLLACHQEISGGRIFLEPFSSWSLSRKPCWGRIWWLGAKAHRVWSQREWQVSSPFCVWDHENEELANILKVRWDLVRYKQNWENGGKNWNNITDWSTNTLFVEII